MNRAEGKGRPDKGVPEGYPDRAQGLGHRLRILAGRKHYFCSHALEETLGGVFFDALSTLPAYRPDADVKRK
jgi:hypothetical protein